jgi:hypothetical protein
VFEFQKEMGLDTFLGDLFTNSFEHTVWRLTEAPHTVHAIYWGSFMIKMWYFTCLVEVF